MFYLEHYILLFKLFINICNGYIIIDNMVDDIIFGHLGAFLFFTFNKNISGWLLSKSLQAINAGEGVEKREPSYTVGGNAN